MKKNFSQNVTVNKSSKDERYKKKKIICSKWEEKIVINVKIKRCFENLVILLTWIRIRFDQI